MLKKVAARVAASRLHGRCLSTASAKRVAIVYGSFCNEQSMEDAELIAEFGEKFGGGATTVLAAGDEFDFNTLQDTTHLVLSTSSWLGFPPSNFSDFAHQLLLASDTAPGCLSHLQHAVWGNGDERWFKTYMNVPRYMDTLLERCGSQRFYARGEWGEPHAPARTSQCELEDWAPGMWDALNATGEANSAPAVAWDALWEYEPSERHQETAEWNLRQLVERRGLLAGEPSQFAKPDEGYWQMIEEVKKVEEARQAEMEERRRRAAATRS